MKKVYLITILFFSWLLSTAQIRRDAVWCFGDSVQIDFNQSPPVVGSCSIRTRGSACSITDTLGNLLFYTQTSYIPLWLAGYDYLGVVWNKNGQIMQNGDSLVGTGWYHEMVIIPKPSERFQYYIFHTGVDIFPELYYSLIEISPLNGGLGKVLQKNILVSNLGGQGVTDGLTAIKHGNGRDWWVICKDYGNTSNAIHRFLVSDQGIGGDSIQFIGSPTFGDFVRLYFNNAGNKMLLLSTTGLIEYYDFDRCTGLLSNLYTINPESFNSWDQFWSAAFSPNDSVLYVSMQSNTSALIQYYLATTGIPNSRLSLYSFNIPVFGAGDLRTAIDGKIYWSIVYYDGINFNFPYPDSVYNSINMNLSVINHPNLLDTACDFQPYSFYLGGKRTYVGLGNNPNYDLGPLPGSVCDTLLTSTESLPGRIHEPVLLAAPVPVKDVVFLNARELKGRKGTLSIYNELGIIIRHEEYALAGDGYFSSSVNLRDFPAGIYLISFETEKERMIKKIVKD